MGCHWARAFGPAPKKYCCNIQSKNAEKILGQQDLAQPKNNSTLTKQSFFFF